MSKIKAILNTRLRPDLATMEINVVGEGGLLAGVVLTADQLDPLMAGLADIRSKMTPEVPQKFPHGKPTHNHQGTAYFFGVDPFSGVPCLSFRSPGFGWLTFGIAEPELDRIYRLLQESKNRPAMPRSDKKQ